MVSPAVWAEIDCRLLPDQDPDSWLAELRSVLGPEIEAEVLMGFTPAVSTTETELFEIIRDVTLDTFLGASFTPQDWVAFRTATFFRDLWGSK